MADGKRIGEDGSLWSQSANFPQHFFGLAEITGFGFAQFRGIRQSVAATLLTAEFLPITSRVIRSSTVGAGKTARRCHPQLRGMRPVGLSQQVEKMQKTLGVALAAGLILGSSFPTARAETVTFEGILVEGAGTGFGNVSSVLGVQAPGSETTEWGAVKWNGTSDDLFGDAGGAPKSLTRTVSELGLLGDDTFAVVFNVNEGGQTKDLLLEKFFVTFWDESGGPLGQAEFSAVESDTFAEKGADDTWRIRLDNVESGSGTAGWLFVVDVTGEDWLDTGTNRIGMEVPEGTDDILDGLTEVDDGYDNFYLADLTGEPPTPLPIPAPSVFVALVSMGALGLVAVARRRRKSK